MNETEKHNLFSVAPWYTISRRKKHKDEYSDPDEYNMSTLWDEHEFQLSLSSIYLSLKWSILT